MYFSGERYNSFIEKHRILEEKRVCTLHLMSKLWKKIPIKWKFLLLLAIHLREDWSNCELGKFMDGSAPKLKES